MVRRRKSFRLVWSLPTMGSNSNFECYSCFLESKLEGCVPFSGVWHEMSPDPILVDRLNQHGQSQLLRWWGELNEAEQGRLASEIRSIDFDRLDRLIADLVVSE